VAANINREERYIMNSTLLTPQADTVSLGLAVQPEINRMIDELIVSLPDAKQLTSEQRRGLIARYSSVLEGNFIYWMTATLIAAEAPEVGPILLENLHEEVRDAHPAMLRRFAIAANAFPTDKDAMVVDADMTKVRLFLGRLSSVQSLVTMAFFEGYIQRFMGYLGELAMLQGSTDMEYTDVHGVCDIAHSQELFRALSLEMEAKPLPPEKDMFEGVDLLRTLIQTIIHGQANALAA
jgi:hypothetical protein